LKALENMELRN